GSFRIADARDVFTTAGFIVTSACLIVAAELVRRSQNRLRRTKVLLEAFLDNTPGSEFLKDEAGRYVYVNKSSTQVFGDLIGKTDFELFPASYALQWRGNDLLVLDRNKAMEFVETSPHPQGERTWLSVKFPVVDDNGRRLLGGKSIDITEMKHAEK